MKHNYKFHAIAIASISLIITVLYLIIDPKPATTGGDPEIHGDQAIEIYSATWGESCNSDIETALNDPVLLATINRAAAEAKRGPLKLVTRNNALATIGDLCNGKLACSFIPNTQLLGDPYSNCFKTLDVSYRCFSYDRLWTLSLDQGKPVTIDCHEQKNPTPAAQ